MEYLLVVTAIALALIFGTRRRAPLPPARCQVCGNPLLRNRYGWQIHGQPAVVCPDCNRQLMAKSSAEALRRLGLRK